MIEAIVKQRDYLVQFLSKQVDHDTAEDIAQEAIIRAIRHIDSFKGLCPLQTWLTTIARRCMIDWMRVAKAHATVPIDEPVEINGAAVNFQEILQDEFAIDPCDEICRKDVSNRLIRLIQALPDNNRDVIVLFHFGDYTYGQIAEMFNVPMANIRTRIHRARKQLRWMIENSEEDLCEV